MKHIKQSLKLMDQPTLSAQNIITTDQIEKLKKATRVIKSINHPLRLKLLEKIYANPGITVTELYTFFKIEQSVTSQQLAMLLSAGVVTKKRAGRHLKYYINNLRIEEIIKYAEALII